MKDLKCGLAECEYNKAYCCLAKKISVSNDAGCQTYKENPSKKNLAFEVAEDFARRNYDVDTQVVCRADCIFNREDICQANGITVLGDLAHEAVCATFMKA